MVKWGRLRIKRQPFLALASIFILIFLLIGCGGGGNAPGKAAGRMTLTLTWPAPVTAPSRLIPAAAQSVKITIRETATTLAERLLVRPANPPFVTTVTINGIPITTVAATAQAFPNADGSGVALATGAAAVTVLPDDPTPLHLTLASTIDRVDITPATPKVTAGKTLTLSATARDAQGAVVMVLTNGFTWSSTDTKIATVNSQTGVVTGVAGGSVTINVKENESAKTGSVTLTVADSDLIAPTYTVTLLPPLGGSEIFLHKMNDRSEVVGYSSDGGSPAVRRATLWRNGQPIDLSQPGDGKTYNEARDITPTSAIMLTSLTGVAILRDSVLTPLNLGPDYTDLRDFALNDNGYAAGYVHRTADNTGYFIGCTVPPKALGVFAIPSIINPPASYPDRMSVDINTTNQFCATNVFGSQQTGFLRGFVITIPSGSGFQVNPPSDGSGYVHATGNAVNDQSISVGTIMNGTGGMLPFWFARPEGGHRIPLPYQSHSKGVANDLNETLLMVGKSWGADGNPVAWASDTKITVDLNTRILQNQGIILTEARAVNNKGEIACIGTLNNQPMGFLLKPQF